MITTWPQVVLEVISQKEHLGSAQRRFPLPDSIHTLSISAAASPTLPTQSVFLFHFSVFVCLAVLGLSCGMWLSCPAACGILVPRPGIELSSPALEGRLSTTGLPGKSPRLGQDQLLPSVQSWAWFPLQRAKQDTHSQTLLYKPERPPGNKQTHNPDTRGHSCTNTHTRRSPQMCASTQM